MQVTFKEKLKKLSSNVLLLNLMVLLLFSCYGLWKFQNALFEKGYTIARSGDGLNTITGIAAYRWRSARFPGYYELTFWEKVKANLITSPTFLIKFGLRGDVRTAAGEMGKIYGGAVRADKYWAAKVWFLNHFFSPDNVYDMIGLIGFVLIGFAGFLLARELGVSPFYAIFAGILLVNIDNFHRRAFGHVIGLGAFYIPVFLTWACVKTGKTPSINNMFLFGIFAVLNIAASPYYGYFGLFFSSVLFISFFTGYGIKNHELVSFKKTFYSFVWKTAVAAAVFSVFIFLVYPTIATSYLTAILSNFLPVEPKEMVFFTEHSHGYRIFTYYSTTNFIALFKPGISWIASVLPDIFSFEPRTYRAENFRIGFLPVAFISFSFLFFFIIRFFPSLKPSWKGLSNEALFIFALFIPTVIFISLFGLSPDSYSFSLVPLTFKIAPFLRNGERAFLYVDIAVITLFVFSLDRFFKWALERKNYALKICMISLLFLFSFTALVDVSGGAIDAYTFRNGDIKNGFVYRIQQDTSPAGRYLWNKLSSYYNGHNIDKKFMRAFNDFLQKDDEFNLFFKDSEDIPEEASKIMNMDTSEKIYRLYELNRLLLEYCYPLSLKKRLRVLTPLNAYSLPDTEIYRTLRDRPDGYLIELPYWHTTNWFYYKYLYNRLFHNKPLINRRLRTDECEEFARKVNKPTEGVLKELMSAGIRYIAADHRQHRLHSFEYDLSYLDESPMLSKIAKQDGTSIYQFDIDETFNTKRFFEDIIMGGKDYSELFLPDFSTLQGSQSENFRWCGNTGDVIIASHMEEETLELIVETDIFSKPGSSLKIKSHQFTETIFFEEEVMLFRQKVTLPPKSNIRISFSSNAVPFHEPTDHRILVFYLGNWRLTRVEK